MPQKSAYFLYHSIGQYPGKNHDIARAMAAFGSAWGALDDGQWGYALGVRQQFIDRWRVIINADPGTLTTCENVTSGLSMMMGSLPVGALKGKRVLIAQDCFPSLHFLLTGLASRLGFTLETVPLRQGQAWVMDEDVIAHWGPDVGLALLTWISSTSSHRCDLNALVAHGREMGSIIGVDITQGAGLLPYDVSAPQIDFAVSTSLKWMCATPGAGVLYAELRFLNTCQPELRGWFSQNDIFSWDLDKFAFAPDIRRFDNGTPGIIACAASLPALDWHAGQDQAQMLAHNRTLSDLIIKGIDDLGLTLATPRPPSERGGSIMVTLAQEHPSQSLLEMLRSQQIFADVRGQTLRLSPGLMTSAQDVDRLITAMSSHLEL